MLTHSHLKRAWRTTSHRLGLCGDNPLVQDASGLGRTVADLFLREVQDDPWLSDELRVGLYSRLRTRGPGGLRALAWMVGRGHTDWGQVDAFLAEFDSGSPCRGGLCEDEALEVVEGLGEALTAQGFVAAARLLSSPLLAPRGRQVAFRRLVSAPWVTPTVRGELCEWALGAGSSAPEPPPELLRPGLVGLLQLGWPPGQLAALVAERLHARWRSEVLRETFQDLAETCGFGEAARMPDPATPLRAQAIWSRKRQDRPLTCEWRLSG